MVTYFCNKTGRNLLRSVVVLLSSFAGAQRKSYGQRHSLRETIVAQNKVFQFSLETMRATRPSNQCVTHQAFGAKYTTGTMRIKKIKNHKINKAHQANHTTRTHIPTSTPSNHTYHTHHHKHTGDKSSSEGKPRITSGKVVVGNRIESQLGTAHCALHAGKNLVSRFTKDLLRSCPDE